MSRVHDLGGLHGLGPVEPTPEDHEPTFHAQWEGRIFAMVLACGALGRWNLDESRHARERLDPVDYLRSSYFERWVAGLETLLVEREVLSAQELASGRSAGTPTELSARRLVAEQVAPALARGRPPDTEPSREPVFRPDDRVRVRPVTTAGHTRAVRYAQGRFGTVQAHRGCHVFPDRNAHGEKVGEHLYNVAFTASELWGQAAAPRDTVRVDLWEAYLEPAP